MTHQTIYLVLRQFWLDQKPDKVYAFHNRYAATKFRTEQMKKTRNVNYRYHIRSVKMEVPNEHSEAVS